MSSSSLQLLLDDEAVGRLDVFQVDAAEAGAQIAHAVDERVEVGRVDQDVDGVDVGEALEEHALAFHDRLGGQRAEIAQAREWPCRSRSRPPGCPWRCSRRQLADPRRSPAPARPRRANRPATGRAAWSSGLVGVISSLPGLPWLWNCRASWAVKRAAGNLIGMDVSGIARFLGKAGTATIEPEAGAHNSRIAGMQNTAPP